jgi:hypothetical protein
MYVTAPSPDAVLALDLRANPPHARWTYRPEVEPAAQGVACLAIVFVFTTGPHSGILGALLTWSQRRVSYTPTQSLIEAARRAGPGGR